MDGAVHVVAGCLIIICLVMAGVAICAIAWVACKPWPSDSEFQQNVEQDRRTRRR